jgi:class 3 adenylate cyclase
LLSREDHEDPQDAGTNRKTFSSFVKDAAFASGAVITGFEGDTILVCFGSPLDKTFDPVKKACAFVKKLLNDEKITWRFGIDFGECTFSWTAETGYSVYGHPAVCARMLVSKTSQLKSHALVTEDVRKSINLNLAKTDTLNEKPVYELN